MIFPTKIRRMRSAALAKQLFPWYRYPIVMRLQANNLFFTIPAYETIGGYNLSAGLLSDYLKKKKKKKIFLLVLDLGTLLADRLKVMGVQDLRLFIKGAGAQKKGVFHAIFRHKLSISSFANITPIVHNGTRPVKKRRL